MSNLFPFSVQSLQNIKLYFTDKCLGKIFSLLTQNPHMWNKNKIKKNNKKNLPSFHTFFSAKTDLTYFYRIIQSRKTDPRTQCKKLPAPSCRILCIMFSNEKLTTHDPNFQSKTLQLLMYVLFSPVWGFPFCLRRKQDIYTPPNADSIAISFLLSFPVL